MTQSSGGIALVGLGGRAASVGIFLRHLLEMLAAMILGMVVLDPLFAGAAGTVGYSDPLRQLPELSALVITFNMSAPMVAWMRYRGMEWGSTLEMSGVMFVEVILLIGACWLGIIAQSSLLHLQHALMIPAMLVAMLYRRDSYTGHAGHRAHAA